jgi:hypothetical protein
MFSKCLAILALFTGLPALAQGPAAVVSPSNSAMPMRHHGIMRLDRVPGSDIVFESTYSSGYAVEGNGPLIEALGSWIAPKVNCTKTANAYSSYLVGMDGLGSETLEGLGTEADCVNSSPSYYAWYEFPTGTKKISGITVSPGDKISATVLYKGSKFTLKMTNHTTGQTFKHTQAFSAQRSNAEWIVETPCCTNGNPSPLADFEAVTLGHDYTGVKHTNWAIDPTFTGPISQFDPIYFIVMIDQAGSVKAEPSLLTPDGSSFDVVWEKSK